MTNNRFLMRRDVIGWSFYDFANTMFSMNIVSLYLKRYIVEDLGRDDRWFDIPYAISMIFAALVLPALGSISDRTGKKKLFIMLFTLVSCVATGIMPFVPPSLLLVLAVLFILANFSYEAGQPFYNALLYSVAEGRQARLLSGVGVAFGYAGSILGMLLVLPFVTGELFSIDLSELVPTGKTAAFVPTAILFLMFSLPLFFWVEEKKSHNVVRMSLRESYRDVWDGLKQTKKYPNVLRFLVADYFLEDAVTTVILNIGLYCSLVLGFSEIQITQFLVISTASAVIGSFLIGKVAQTWSLKSLLTTIVWGWIFCLMILVFFNHPAVIWILGSVIGVLLGGLWTTTRPMLAELVPKDELGKFFGLFSLSGRSAAVVGPLIWTTVVYLFRPEHTLGLATASFLGLDEAEALKLPYKAAVLSLVITMAIGLYILRKIPHSRGEAGA